MIVTTFVEISPAVSIGIEVPLMMTVPLGSHASASSIVLSYFVTFDLSEETISHNELISSIFAWIIAMNLFSKS